jgi:uncharacterized protein (TIGR03083 family)
MDKADYLEALESESHAFVAAAAAAPLDTPVPWCGDWTLFDLVKHQTIVWGFALANVQAGGEKSAPASTDAPSEQAALVDWVSGVREQMLEALQAADPEQPAWTFAPNDQSAGFWQRRMLHETMVHRWDAQAAGLDIEPMYPHLAADGIDEYTQVGLQFSSGRPDRTYPEQSLHLHCTDTEGEWTLVGDGGSNVTVTREHAKGDAAVRGPAADLLLWIWGRPGGEVTIFGDETVATTWRELAP